MAGLNYEELTKGLATKSEKIRVLGRKGVPTADIARFLGIRYQHARNVLNDAGLHGGMAEEMPALETKMMPQVGSAQAVPKSVWVDLDASGRLAIPTDMREHLGLKPGDGVYLELSEDGIQLLSQDGAIKRVQRIAAKYKRPGVSEVDLFIEEKRREAREDDERWEREHAKWAK
jgi:bifunctional DNA-binding transcriptional regulator/antitoxin component of YhaV-PrlF toxin-antitoxin module